MWTAANSPASPPVHRSPTPASCRRYHRQAHQGSHRAVIVQSIGTSNRDKQSGPAIGLIALLITQSAQLRT